MRKLFGVLITGILIYILISVIDFAISLIIGLTAGGFQSAFSVQAMVSRFWPLVWGFSAFLGTLIGYKFLLKNLNLQNYKDLVLPTLYIAIVWLIFNFIATSILLHFVAYGIVNIYGPLWPFVIFQLNLFKNLKTFAVVLIGVLIGSSVSFRFLKYR
jgi:hypothetical protein